MPQQFDQRVGPLDRRVSDLEGKYSTIIERLDTIDANITELNTLKNQIQGMINLVKFVGWGGLITMAILLIKYLK